MPTVNQLNKSNQLNQMPKATKRKKCTSKSGYFGVKRSVCKSAKGGYKWKGRVRIDGKRVFLKGVFDTPLECAKAYDLRGIKERIPIHSKMTSLFFDIPEKNRFSTY